MKTIMYLISFLFLATFPCTILAQADGKLLLRADSAGKPAVHDLEKIPWKYHPGDTLAWARPSYNDSLWVRLKPDFDVDSLPPPGWQGIGWFRLHVSVDSTLRNKMFEIVMRHLGASEVYLDGVLVHRFGKMTPDQRAEETYMYILPISIYFDGRDKHLIAVRYSFLNARSTKSRYLISENAGFSMSLDEHGEWIYWFVQWMHINLAGGMLSFGVLLMMSLLHFLLFAFYPKERTNLIFGFFSAGFAVLSYLWFLWRYTHPGIEARILEIILFTCLWPATAATFLLVLYSTFRGEIKKYAMILFPVTVLVTAIFLLRPSWQRFLGPVFLAMLALEGLRVDVLAMVRKQQGAWILGAGAAIALISAGVFLLWRDLLFSWGWYQFTSIQTVIYLSVPIAMSVVLARRIAGTNKTLELKLIEVKDLSEKQLAGEQEKKKLIEAQKEQLEIEVAERTKELRKEKEETERLLYNILPVEIAKELREKGTTIPRRYEEITILFTDFRGFTNTVAAMPAKKLVEELNDIFRDIDDIIDKYGLEKIKTIGDSYMIAAGLPKESENHAVQCVKAAMEMVRFIAKRNESSAIKWQMRVGVHSGAAVAGVVGKKKFTYDVWGDTVNIASRMETSGEPGKVNISAYTYDLIKKSFECEYRGKVDAKGKGEIDMYFVVCEKAEREHQV